jgi:hypothetical protein
MRTRQKIESELDASERDKAVARFCEVVADYGLPFPSIFRWNLMARIERIPRYLLTRIVRPAACSAGSSQHRTSLAAFDVVMQRGLHLGYLRLNSSSGGDASDEESGADLCVPQIDMSLFSPLGFLPHLRRKP